MTKIVVNRTTDKTTSAPVALTLNEPHSVNLASRQTFARRWNLTAVIRNCALAAAAVSLGVVSTVSFGLPLAVVSSLLIIVVPWRGDYSKPLAIFFAAYFLGPFLPGVLNLALQVAALVVPFVVWNRSARRRAPFVVAVAFATVVYWGLLAFHPNVPSLEVGLLGVRKSTLVFGGLVLGCSIAESKRHAIERLVVDILTGVLAISVAIHIWVPSVESGIARGADRYTSTFDGVQRLQGVLAGPFHVSLAASFLVLWSIGNLRTHVARSLAGFGVGLLALQMSAVRTGFAAVAVGVCVLVASAPSPADKVRRFATVSAIGILVAVGANVMRSDVSALESLSHGTSDSRFQSRLPTYAQGAEAVVRSPVFGWGAGSSGDTLGPRFEPSGVHVTAHNVLLRSAVEGGFIGLGLVVATAVAASRRLQRSHAVLMAAAAMAAFGLTGSMIEALPITYLLAVMIGAAID